jgi:hypothetical protein
MRSFFLRLQEAGRVLAADADDVLAFGDIETARCEAERGAKHLLIECIRTGRDPSGDAVLIVDRKGAEVERIALLDVLPQVLSDRIKAR